MVPTFMSTAFALTIFKISKRNMAPNLRYACIKNSQHMKSIILLSSFAISVAGGFLGVQLATAGSVVTPTENVHTDNLQTDGNLLFTNESETGIYPASLTSDVQSSGYPDLTYASEKTAQTVAHIQTHFVREEIVYDPFAQFFYGEDAYKTRERHGKVSGSGVVISPDGYIVTNNHVVQDAKEIAVVLDDKTYTATLVGRDPSTDLAVVKIEANGLTYSTFGNSDKLRLGEWVLAVGNPMNLQTTVTAGIVSAKNRNIDLLTSKYNPEENVFPIESFIQTDAAVNSGNSGGALVNISGELVGINTAIASGNGFYTGYSFAIPSNIVKKVAMDLIAYGTVQRVQLGAGVLDNNSEVAKKNQLASQHGIVINTLVENGNAERSDLRVNDIILEINGSPVESVAEFQGKLVLCNPGDSVTLKIQRGNTEKEVSMSLR
jgi:serine protease Do